MKRIMLLIGAALLAGCSDGGASTEDVRLAAIERVRSELKLPANAPLTAQVWTGAEYEGDPTACGTVSGGGIGPQRFLASVEPLRFLVMEDAHKPMIVADQNKFPEWGRYCAGTQGS